MRRGNYVLAGLCFMLAVAGLRLGSAHSATAATGDGALVASKDQAELLRVKKRELHTLMQESSIFLVSPPKCPLTKAPYYEAETPDAADYLKGAQHGWQTEIAGYCPDVATDAPRPDDGAAYLCGYIHGMRTGKLAKAELEKQISDIQKEIGEIGLQVEQLEHAAAGSGTE